MRMNTDAVYWYKNQVTIMYRSELSPDITSKVTSFRRQLNQDVISVTGFKLLPFSSSNVPHTKQQEEAGAVVEADDPYYLFRLPKRAIDTVDHADIVAFYHVVPEPNEMEETMREGGSMNGNGGTNSMGNDNATDNTLVVVDQLNNHKRALQSKGVSSFDAMPHWFGAGTDGDVPVHGCPVSPPIPIHDSNASGQWKITLPKVTDPSLLDKTGDGVMVFILDTLPTRDQILQAAETVGSNNMLLQHMAEQIKLENIKICYQDVPDRAQTAVTGKDIYGRLTGFPMADHGLFIAGIVHGLASKAKIECIRVLNDYGVGDYHTLVNVVEHINNRMSNPNPEMQQKGDLFGESVVINLSLVMSPPESDLSRFGWDTESRKPPLEGVQNLFKHLVQAGAIIAASAGNDSDPRDIMNALEERFGPRYPAAFAYDDPPLMRVIPVGAVNRKGNAAMYSNHPGPNGIATYGGELPKPDPWLPSAMSHRVTGVDTTEPLDALRGVYSASRRPALSKNDHHAILPSSPSAYPMYHASNTWVCWSGTSFATPIITALAARILQGRDPKSVDVQQAIVDAATGETVWTRVENEDIPGPVIMAVQEWYPLDPPNPKQ
ncbi:MAG: S8 family serine peptidase [Ktedonobacteraceae bacterium]